MSYEDMNIYKCIYVLYIYYIHNIWRRQWHPTPAPLPGKSHGHRSLVGLSPWGRWGSDTTEQLHFHFSLSCIGEGKWQPTAVFLPGESQGWEAWWAAVYRVRQSRTRLKWLSSNRGKKESQKQERPIKQVITLLSKNGYWRLDS